MSSSNQASTPPADVLATCLGGIPPPEPAQSLGSDGHWGHLIQDFRPMCQALEWQLSHHVWMHQGARPFVEGGVPYVVNNSGSSSRQAAAVLLQALSEHPPAGTIRVLEIGAGTGLFARLLLDEFVRLCVAQGREEHQRLEYWVSDASPTMVAHWQHIDLFGPHATRVVTRVAEAQTAAAIQPEPWHAVFANYVLDVLPSRVLRSGEEGWEELHVRTWVRGDVGVLRRYSPLTPAELRSHADSGDPARLQDLVGLLPVLEGEAAFLGIPNEALPVPAPAAAAGMTCTVNTEALRCLDILLPRLAPGAFCLISDYAAEPGVDAQQQSAQRFGPISAMGLNLSALQAHVQAAGFRVEAADGDGDHPLRHRLLVPGPAPQTTACFRRLFGAEELRWREEPVQRARHHVASGQWAQARADYKRAIDRAPGDWSLLTEAAAFAGCDLADPPMAQALAHAALAQNPWTNPRAWTVLADALSAQGLHDAAYQACQQAWYIHPRDARTCLSLSRCRHALGRHAEALQAVADGLASDTESMFRHLLLDQQALVLSALTTNWGFERAAAARRIG